MPSTKQIDEILDNVIRREGGYVAHPKDPGGETKYGISKRSYPGLDIKNLTIPQAKDIYCRDFILPHRLQEIHHPLVMEQILDWIINSGPGVVKAPERVKALQRLIGIDADGIVGTKTIEAINQYDSTALVQRILYDRLFFYCRLTKHPFITGWVRRLVELGL